jgi:SAM-dependent methyltransferase
MPTIRKQQTVNTLNGKDLQGASDGNTTVLNIPKERGVRRFDEERLIRDFICATGLDSSAKILDVGCGFGSKMAWLIEDGYSPHGVDINPKTVEAAQTKGFHCMTPGEFALTDEAYDLILMAHIVEHFYPDDLLKFVDSYLDRLKIRGYLLIATPLHSKSFYSDFDHIKAYHPQAFISVLCRPESQVQYHSRHRLKMVNFGLGRRPWEAPIYEDLYCSFNKIGFSWRLRRCLMHRLRGFIFCHTGGVLGGMTDRWVGLFQKEV